MPPKKDGGSGGGSKKAKERKERKLLEERIANSKAKCEEARAFLEPVGKHSEPNYAKAREALNEAIGLYDAHALPYFLIGECSRSQGALREAIVSYSKALDVDPRYAPALEGRAISYQKLGDIAHAIEDYSSMIQQDPENDHAFNMRGVCLASIRIPGLRLKNADFKRCESDLKTAARLNEANYYALANLGKLYEDQGDLEAALSWYTASLKVKESYSYARFRRGFAGMTLGERILTRGASAADALLDVEGADTIAPAASKAAIVVENITDAERELREKKKEEEELAKAKSLLVNARADFVNLLNANPAEDRTLADANVVLNVGVSSMLLEDLNEADDAFALLEQIIAARPALVESGEAAPIDNVDYVTKVLELRKGELRKRKLARAQGSA